MNFEALTHLLGTWHGQGRGSFPTIDDFEFLEETRFERRGDEQLLHFDQRTTLKDGTPSHWESGIWRVSDEGLVEVSIAQDSGRVEVLVERDVQLYPDGFSITLDCKVVANDPRLVTTGRRYEVRGGTLTYETSMETTKVRPILGHIQGLLHRQ